MSVALASYKSKTCQNIQRSFRFRRTLTAVEWSERVRRMDGNRPFRFDFAPYQREMMEAPFREDVQTTVYMMASRLGKTEVMMNIIGHGVCESQRRILAMYPTISQAEKWSKETLMTELVAPTPELDRILGDGVGRRKSGNTILHKMFPGGSLNAFGSNAPGEMRRAKGNLLIADEIDAIVGAESDEGDALEIFWVRGSEYPDAIKIAASYPSIKGRSKIESLMLQSDWREWWTPCPHCNESFVLDRTQLRFDPIEPEKAWLECPHNNCRVSDAERVAMIKRGEWRASRPFTGIAGFQASRMISPHPPQKGFHSHLHWCAVEQLKIEKSENREKAMRVLVNTFDGLTYSPPEQDKPDPETMERQCYDYLSQTDTEGRYILPAGVLFISIGADVQGDRIEAEIVGYGKENQTWGLGYHVLPGSPLEPEVWEKFDKLTLTEFAHPSNRILRPVITMIDSGFKPDSVRAFTTPRQARRVYAVLGSKTLSKPIVSPPRKMGNTKVFELGTHEAKSLIYQRAHLTRASGSSEYPNGYMHYPKGHGYHSQYFQRLLVEDVSLKKAPDGDFYEFFSNDDKQRNEPIDIRVYSLAGEKWMKPQYAKIGEKYAQKAENKEMDTPESYGASRNYILDT